MTIREWLNDLPQDIKEQVVSIQNNSAFGGVNGRHMRLKSGYTISIQWGFGMYCDNHRMIYKDIMNPPELNCANAEIAYWLNDGGMLPFEDGDTVCGYQTPEQIEVLVRELILKGELK